MRSIRKSLWFLASLAALMLLAVGAYAADFYVDVNTGLDTNPGTQAQPFQTIQKGINTAAANDTLHVAAGTYRESLDWKWRDLVILGDGEGGASLTPARPTAAR